MVALLAATARCHLTVVCKTAGSIYDVSTASGFKDTAVEQVEACREPRAFFYPAL